MGYYIFGFGVKQKEVLDFFNSRDEEIIKKVEQNEYFENYYGDVTDDFSVKTALHDIVKGNTFNEKMCYEYGYAVISLCATLGQELPYQQEIKLGYETDYIDQFLAEDFGLKDFVFDEYLFDDKKLSSFPIPKIEDWPMISVIPLAELKSLKKQFVNVKISNETIEELLDSEDENDEEKGYSYEHIKGIINNINFCIENELDLFSACH